MACRRGARRRYRDGRGLAGREGPTSPVPMSHERRAGGNEGARKTSARRNRAHLRLSDVGWRGRRGGGAREHGSVRSDGGRRVGGASRHCRRLTCCASAEHQACASLDRVSRGRRGGAGAGSYTAESYHVGREGGPTEDTRRRRYWNLWGRRDTGGDEVKTIGGEEGRGALAGGAERDMSREPRGGETPGAASESRRGRKKKALEAGLELGARSYSERISCGICTMYGVWGKARIGQKPICRGMCGDVIGRGGDEVKLTCHSRIDWRRAVECGEGPPELERSG